MASIRGSRIVAGFPPRSSHQRLGGWSGSWPWGGRKVVGTRGLVGSSGPRLEGRGARTARYRDEGVGNCCRKTQLRRSAK